MPVQIRSAGLGFSTLYYSDDGGFVWQRSKSDLSIKLGGGMGFAAFVEPTVAEVRDGRLIMIGRNSTGRMWKSVSSDRGERFCDPVPMDLAASHSPALITRIPSTDHLMLAWNQVYEFYILSMPHIHACTHRPQQAI